MARWRALSASQSSEYLSDGTLTVGKGLTDISLA
jgi:hypothetical protein